MTNEIYKTIENYKIYAVSNFGNIKNIKTGRILKPIDNGHGYLAVKLYCEGKTKNFKIHRLVAFEFLEKVEGKSVVDHKDNDRTNNKASNLRFCSSSQNSMNAKKRSKKTSSKFKGVTFYKKNQKWMSYITINNKQTTIGYFKNEIKAAHAYDAKAKELFGEFAKCNFQEDD